MNTANSTLSKLIKGGGWNTKELNNTLTNLMSEKKMNRNVVSYPIHEGMPLSVICLFRPIFSFWRMIITKVIITVTFLRKWG